MRLFALLISSLWWSSSLVAAPVINEVQATNTAWPDPHGQLIDWVEIHNPTAGPVSLSGYYLADSTSNRLKFQFGDVTISAGGYLLVWCGQVSEFPVTGPYPEGQLRATGFAISSGGEPIVLTAPDGITVIDEFPALVMGAGRSLGRGTGGEFDALFFYDAPTPGAANTTAGTPARTLEPPVFSVPGGIYTSDVTLELGSAAPGAVIRYTTDGSDPTENSPVYDGPLTLTSRRGEPNNYSEIPTNRQNLPYDESWQPPADEVFKINVIRARAFQTGLAPSRIATHSYLVDEDGTGRYPFPVISIATDPDGLFSDETGIYVHGSGGSPNYAQSGSAWERPGQIEFFEADGTLAFRGDMGVRLHGNNSVSRPRKSLRIYSRDVTGAPFNHRIFPQKEIDQFSTFLLRNSGNDWGQAMLRDAFLTGLAAHTGIDHQSARPAVVFLDGEYWGLHNLRDRIDEGYYLRHHGLGEMEFTQLDVHWQPVRPHWPVYDRGNPDPAMLQDFEDILNRAGNDEYASEPSFAALADRIDIGNYIDYNAYQIFAGNGDWPGNNTRLWRAVQADRSPGARPTHDGRWRWILFDVDFGLGLNFDYVPGWNLDPTQHAQVNTLALATSETQTSFANAPDGTLLLRKLTANPVFRRQFINRLADLLNTAMSPARTTNALAEVQALYAAGMDEHVARWRQPYNWSGDMERIRTFLQARPAAVRGHIAGKFGLSGLADLTVDVTDPDRGSVTVNTISIDPSTVGVASDPYPWTGTYFQGVPVTLTAVPKPGYRFIRWQRAAEAGTVVTAADAAAGYMSWDSGSNGGTGFGPWSLQASTSNSGNAGWFLDNGRGGWGLYANRGQLAEAIRPLGAPLGAGQTFAVRLKHGNVAPSGDVGIALLDDDGLNFFRLRRLGSSDRYEINGQTGEIPVTTSPLDVEFSMTSASTFTARVTPVGGETYEVSGTLPADGTGVINRFQAFNYSAGSGGDADFFITSLQISESGSEADEGYEVFSTTATITPTLSAGTAFRADFEPEPAAALAMAPPVWTSGFTNTPVTVRAVNSLGDTDANFSGTVILTITGPGGVVGTYSAQAVGGIATFAAVDLPAGDYGLSAVSGELSTVEPVSLTVRGAATFLPPGNGVWHNAANWDSGAVPDSPAVSVIIPPNTAANRNVTNNAPTTVASVTFELGGSAFRNRITGTDGQPLTLQSTGGVSSITVTGTGAGHANIEVPGGLVFANEVVLDVQNIGSTNAEYGALRLQGAVAGPGAIIKRGPGMAGLTGAGKTFSGDVVIEQGVLTFTEPALSGNSVTNYTVQPGGQLRLSSAGHPRNYLFKGPLHLAGSGRTGVPEGESLGVLGALRLETGGTGTVAVLTNNVHLTDAAVIHVPAANAIRLDGPLTAASSMPVLTKSGGGTLTLSAGAGTFPGGIAVSRGTLELDGASLTNTSRTLDLAGETTLAGRGRWGGELRLQNGAALAVTAGPAPGTGAPLRVGSLQIDGTAVLEVTWPDEIAPGRYAVLEVDGSAGGQWTVATVPDGYPGARVLFDGGTYHVLLGESTDPLDEWIAGYDLTGDDALDLADPDGDGIPNILERALGLSPVQADATLPVILAPEGDAFAITYPVARGQTDLQVVPETAADLAPGSSWTAVTPVLVDGGGQSHDLYRAQIPSAAGSGYLRLRVIRTEF
jgi:autotransporter-associated beta strand protein